MPSANTPADTHSPAHAQIHVSVHTYKQVVHNTGAHSDTPGTQSGIGFNPPVACIPGGPAAGQSEGLIPALPGCWPLLHGGEPRTGSSSHPSSLLTEMFIEMVSGSN